MNENNQIRMTEQRRVILEELKEARCHPTASDIYDRVRKKLPNISLGTVYRNLELLSEHGLIRVLELSGERRRYDGETGEHFHLRCRRCGRVVDIELRGGRLPCDIEPPEGWELCDAKLEFVGLCPDCIEKENDRRN